MIVGLWDWRQYRYDCEVVTLDVAVVDLLMVVVQSYINSVKKLFHASLVT